MRLSLGDTTTIISLGDTTTEFFADASGNVDKGIIKSLFTTSVTTSTASIVPDVNVRLDATRDYVASMSVQEIDQMLVELDEQEQQILNVASEPVKVKTIGTKSKF